MSERTRTRTRAAAEPPQDPETGQAARGMAVERRGRGPWANVGVPTEKALDFGPSVRRLLRLLAPERLGVLAVVVLGVSGVGLNAFGPLLLGAATDVIVDGAVGAGVDTAALTRVLLTAIAVYAGAALFTWGQGYLLNGVVQRTVFDLRRDVEDKLNRLPLRYFDTQPRGEVLSRVTNDIDNVSQSLQQTVSQLFTSLLTVTGVLAMMIVVSPLLSIVAIVLVPASLGLTKAITKRSQRQFVAQWRYTGQLNAQVEEAFTGHELVRVFGRRSDVVDAFAATNDRLFAASFRAQFVSGTIMPSMMFLGNLAYVAIAVLGGLRVASGAISLGDVQAFILYSRQFSQPLTQIASMLNLLQSGVASAERVFELLDEPEQRPDPARRTTAPQAIRGERCGRVEFEHVSFRYRPDQPLIEDLSLVAEPGQTVAIVGPTGAGKTTLVNLILRFYELDAGRITLDGADIAGLARAELRSGIGMVLQDTWLFGGTIRDNIAYGNPTATADQLLAAARATYVDRFVRSLPDGYDTVIDSEGSNVSAGEKQLITIARAFLADPLLLILDEATSSVDTRTEVLVQRAMAALRTERTSFVIAHRLSTIRDADLILVMEAGRIVEQGTHDQLLAAGGAYVALYDAQFAGAADPTVG
jgi:ATP-binding cassette subfamily B multidrug efflux pump